MYLLDTNIVSELRKNKPHGAVLAWLQTVVDADLHLCAVTIGEIQAGIEITRAQDAAKATDIETWLNQVAMCYNVLPITATIYRAWAKLMVGQPKILYEDALIAACAMTHQLTVVTRNVRDFACFPVTVLNPFDNELGN